MILPKYDPAEVDQYGIDGRFWHCILDQDIYLRRHDPRHIGRTFWAAPHRRRYGR